MKDHAASVDQPAINDPTTSLDDVLIKMLNGYSEMMSALLPFVNKNVHR